MPFIFFLVFESLDFNSEGVFLPLLVSPTCNVLKGTNGRHVALTGNTPLGRSFRTVKRLGFPPFCLRLCVVPALVYDWCVVKRSKNGRSPAGQYFFQSIAAFHRIGLPKQSFPPSPIVMPRRDRIRYVVFERRKKKEHQRHIIEIIYSISPPEHVTYKFLLTLLLHTFFTSF